MRCRQSATQTSRSIVDVLKADDVVFAEIAAGLHFDQLQINFARIGQAVLATDRQVD